LYVDQETLPEGELALAHVLQRQISYFADLESFNGLLRHLGDSPWCQVLEVLRHGFNKENPREPFYLWNMEPIDSDLKDLIGGLTNFDPAKRLTASEALSHKWFHDV
jgi:serine/threonine protein kinase